VPAKIDGLPQKCSVEYRRKMPTSRIGNYLWISAPDRPHGPKIGLANMDCRRTKASSMQANIMARCVDRSPAGYWGTMLPWKSTATSTDLPSFMALPRQID
jgi:hypothetical protein